MNQVMIGHHGRNTTVLKGETGRLTVHIGTTLIMARINLHAYMTMR